MKQTALILVLTVSLVNAYSEVSGFQSGIVNEAAGFQEENPGNGLPAAGQGANSLSSGNSLSQGITAATIQDASLVKENMENDMRGREYKAADARNQGNTGSAVAAVTGAALATAAVPLLMSIFPFEQAAGADLMAKAGLEFAQAAADKGSANKNDSQEKLLRKEVDEGSAATGGDPMAAGRAALNDPKLDQMLISKGINPEDFKNVLASGNLRSSEDVMKALGTDTSAMDGDDKLKADALANSVLGNVFGASFSVDPEKNGSVDRVSQMINEENNLSSRPGEKNDSGSANGGAYSNSGGGVGATGSAATGGSSANHDAGGDSRGVQTAAMAQSKKSGANAGAEEGFGAMANGFLNGLLGGSSASASASTTNANALRSMSETQLKSLGISRQTRGNIFQIASQNFRSFGKWRAKERKIATR